MEFGGSRERASPAEWPVAAQKAAPQGVDVLYDPVGGEPFQEALKTVNWGAHILIIGFASGTIPKVTPPPDPAVLEHIPKF